MHLESALGLAASSAAGLFAFLGGGGDVKRLHAGHAAREGLLAALLARQGVQGPPHVLEAPDGFFQAFAGAPAGTELVFGELGILDCYIKPHACCRHLQPALEALIGLVADHGLEAGAIEENPCGNLRDRRCPCADGLGRLRLGATLFPFVLAMGLRFGAADLPHFSAEHREDPSITGVCDRIRVSTAADLDCLYPEQRPARVTVRTPLGSFTRAASEALGSRLLPLDDAALSRKFLGLAEPVLGNDAANILLDALWRIDACADVTRP